MEEYGGHSGFPNPNPSASYGECVETRDFAALFAEHHDFVWRNLRRLGVPEAMAEDGVQEVFLRLHGRPDALKEASSERAWIYGIVRRIAALLRRTEARRDRRHRALHTLNHETRPRHPDLSALSVDTSFIVDQLLDALEPSDRDLIILVDLEGFTGPEIARIYGIEAVAAYAKIRTARRRARSTLLELRNAKSGHRQDRDQAATMLTPALAAWALASDADLALPRQALADLDHVPAGAADASWTQISEELVAPGLMEPVSAVATTVSSPVTAAVATPSYWVASLALATGVIVGSAGTHLLATPQGPAQTRPAALLANPPRPSQPELPDHSKVDGAPVDPDSELRRETSMLEAALAAYDAGDYGLVTEILDRADSLAGSATMLATERATLRAKAACRMRTPDARPGACDD